MNRTKKGTFEGGIQMLMRANVGDRCLWTAITKIMRFVLQSEKTEGFYNEFVSSHCEHTKTLIRDLFQAYWAGE